jgi:hypothetical protein
LFLFLFPPIAIEGVTARVSGFLRKGRKRVRELL